MSQSSEDGFTVVELEIPQVQQQCANCTWTGQPAGLKPIGRCVLTAGDPSPSGRCPLCGELCYLKGSEVTAEAMSTVRKPPATNHQLMFESFGLSSNYDTNEAGDYTCAETVKAFAMFMTFSAAADRELASSRIEINTKAQLVIKLERDVDYWKAKATRSMVGGVQPTQVPGAQHVY